MHLKIDAFSFILWCLLIPLCAVSSGYSTSLVLYESFFNTYIIDLEHILNVGVSYCFTAVIFSDDAIW